MRNKLSVLSVISVTHALVDAGCAALVISIANSGASSIDAFSIVLLYNLLAFATQPLFGFIADRYFNASRVVVFGCVMTAAGILLFQFPLLAVFLVGIGNSLFHVGGGIISLEIEAGKAWAPGIFVAPGNIGLVAGTLIAKRGYTFWYFAILLLFASFIIMILKVSKRGNSIEAVTERRYSKLFYVAVILILTTVVIRSFIGLDLNYSWKKDTGLLIILSVCVTIGKALGGILSDKYGLLKVSVFGVLISIPCLVLGFTHPALGIVGSLLFNLTMPVTLVVTANMFPKYKGLAFGLTVVALSIGTIPVFSGVKLAQGTGISVIILTSAVTLFMGLYIYERIIQKNKLEV